MPYLTQAEYAKITGMTAPMNFDELEKRASNELDVVTRFYYARNQIGDDFKSKQFKKAIAYQIEFYVDSETTSSEALNSKPDSVRVGNTTVSYNRTGTGAESSKRTSAVSQDALNMLIGTGLRYGGASYHL